MLVSRWGGNAQATRRPEGGPSGEPRFLVHRDRGTALALVDRVSPPRPEPAHVALAVAWIVVQIALPASWYLGEGRYDERFAWRMFSTERIVRCAPRFVADGEAVRMGERWHVVWIKLVKRGRTDVADAMAAELCAEARDVRLHLSCRLPDGSVDEVASGRTNRCDR